MPEEDQNYSEGSENRRRPLWWIVFPLLLVLSLLVNGYLYYKYYNSTHDADGASYEAQYKEIVIKYDAEKSELIRQLDEVKAQLERTMGKNLDLSAYNDSLTNQIDEKTLQLAKKIKAAGASNPKALMEAKAEIENLKRLRVLLESKTDSLSEGNKVLIADLLQANIQLDESSIEVRNLQNQKNALNDKIKNNTLSTADLKVMGIRKKGSTEEETYKASKINKLKITFTLLENELVEAGDKEITIRIIGTNKEVLTEENPSLTDTDKLSSKTETVNYQNEQIKVVINYSQKAIYKKGAYSIELIHKDKLMGRASFILK